MRTCLQMDSFGSSNCSTTRMSLANLLRSVILLILISDIKGRSPSRVIGGPKARIGEFKYQVSFWEDDHYMCSGCILDKKHILLAAHCIYSSKPSKIKILAGILRLDQKDAISRDVAEIHIHPWFNYGSDDCFSMKNDIAVLTLNESLPESSNLESLKIPKSDVNIGEIGYLAGWGRSTPNEKFSMDLLRTTFKILKPESCRMKGMSHQRNEFCAIHPKKSVSVSTGDSGSPLVVGETVVGILSTCAASCATDRPAIFTKVFSHVGFIIQVLRK